MKNYFLFVALLLSNKIAYAADSAEKICFDTHAAAVLNNYLGCGGGFFLGFLGLDCINPKCPSPPPTPPEVTNTPAPTTCTITVLEAPKIYPNLETDRTRGFEVTKKTPVTPYDNIDVKIRGECSEGGTFLNAEQIAKIQGTVQLTFGSNNQPITGKVPLSVEASKVSRGQFKAKATFKGRNLDYGWVTFTGVEGATLFESLIKEKKIRAVVEIEGAEPRQTEDFPIHTCVHVSGPDNALMNLAFKREKIFKANQSSTAIPGVSARKTMENAKTLLARFLNTQPYKTFANKEKGGVGLYVELGNVLDDPKNSDSDHSNTCEADYKISIFASTILTQQVRAWYDNPNLTVDPQITYCGTAGDRNRRVLVSINATTKCPYPATHWIHELGHAIGGLVEEYLNTNRY